MDGVARPRGALPLAFVLSLTLLASLTRGQEEPKAAGEEDAIGIRDNSFLVEEAFNQDQGVCQHIFNWVPSWDRDAGVRTRTFNFMFTQEWPVGSQLHQLSYTIPLERISAVGPDAREAEVSGTGNVMLNYRLQVFDAENEPFAFAPRCSLILPPADGAEGSRVGYQLNLPFSKEFNHWVVHFNAGLTVGSDVLEIQEAPLPPLGHMLRGYNLGFSVVRVLSPKFHLMLETVGQWDEELLADGSHDHTNAIVISPGFRWAP